MVKLTERIPGFVRLDDTSSFYQPAKGIDATATLQDKQSDPDLIVFCSWMSAAPKHITKYTAAYQSLFPNTAILLIEAKLGDMFIGNNLDSACTIIRRYMDAKTPLAYRTTASIAFHASSNGGANNAVTLATLLKSQGYVAPFDTITLDCSPGKAEIHSAARAIRLSLPDILFLRTLSAGFIYFSLFMYMIYNTILQRTDKITQIRTTLNCPTLLGVNVPRLYLYSRADLLVEAGHVHEHAVEAARNGDEGGVTEEVFERAPHCALLNEDAGRYWSAVERVVRTGSKPFVEQGWGGGSVVGM